jgi:steroid 5-alpha reductase family enzyme
MAAAWIWQWRHRDAGIVDVCWAALIGCLCVLYGIAADGDLGRRTLVAVLGGIWAFRLAGYLFVNRVLKAHAEDGRYQAMRGACGRWAQPVFFVFFQIQASWSVLFSLPMLAAAFHKGPLGIFDAIGVAIWAIAIGGEALADWQLARWRANPANKGRTCRAGLWRYSRHPNYFFEWVHWFAWVAMAAWAPLWWMSLLGPVLMFLFLYYVTGIPFTEQQAIRSRGDDYRRYQKETSMFFPWFPKKVTTS